MEEFHEFGVEKLPFHLTAGQSRAMITSIGLSAGLRGSRRLGEDEIPLDTMQRLGYLFGIHDQYRDYYKDAPSFDEDYAVRLTDGSHSGACPLVSLSPTSARPRLLTM